MKMCGICNEHPAVNGGLCPGCHESMVGFESSSEGVVLRILKRILVAAEEGGLRVKQSDAIAFKIIEMIERTDGAPCACLKCDRTLTVDDVCHGVIGHIEEMIGEFRKFGCGDDAE